jgi:threonine synthase
MNRVTGFSCIRCGACYPRETTIDSRGCAQCCAQAPANLRVVYDKATKKDARWGSDGQGDLPSLWRYADELPHDAAEAVSLGEGLTPLLPAKRLGASLGVPKLLIKNEGTNPTWSHKDRFSTVAVSVARSKGARVVATSSSGNAGASLAAYAARAGLICVVATFAGTAGPMVNQIRKYGGQVVPFERKPDRWSFIAEGVERRGWFATSPFRAPVVGSHPIGIEGYKTLAYEMVEQMHGDVPDWCVLPVCYGDALAGLWDGFKELFESGRSARLPRLLAAEVHGSLAAALAREGDGLPDVGASFDPLAISVGATRSTFQALQALRQSYGAAIAINNDGLIALQERLAETEGVFAELSSVLPFAAIAKARRDGLVSDKDTVVAIATASGLKDLDRSAGEQAGGPAFASLAEAWEHLDRQTEFFAARAQEAPGAQGMTT